MVVVVIFLPVAQCSTTQPAKSIFTRMESSESPFGKQNIFVVFDRFKLLLTTARAVTINAQVWHPGQPESLARPLWPRWTFTSPTNDTHFFFSFVFFFFLFLFFSPYYIHILCVYWFFPFSGYTWRGASGSSFWIERRGQEAGRRGRDRH